MAVGIHHLYRHEILLLTETVIDWGSLFIPLIEGIGNREKRKLLVISRILRCVCRRVMES
jgi:hypothetical protein